MVQRINITTREVTNFSDVSVKFIIAAKAVTIS